jgi:hypothetical protein
MVDDDAGPRTRKSILISIRRVTVTSLVLRALLRLRVRVHIWPHYTLDACQPFACARGPALCALVPATKTDTVA